MRHVRHCDEPAARCLPDRTAVLHDAHDEGEETLRLALSNAAGSRLPDESKGGR